MPENNPSAGQDGAQQAPMGVSPATGPTPNKGYEAAVIQRMGLMLNQIYEMIPMVGATSEMGQNLRKIGDMLAKMVPTGASSPASDRNQINRMMMQNQQNMQAGQQMKPQAPPQGAQLPGGPPMMQPRVAA